MNTMELDGHHGTQIIAETINLLEMHASADHLLIIAFAGRHTIRLRLDLARSFTLCLGGQHHTLTLADLLPGARHHATRTRN